MHLSKDMLDQSEGVGWLPNDYLGKKGYAVTENQGWTRFHQKLYAHAKEINLEAYVWVSFQEFWRVKSGLLSNFAKFF